MKDKIWAYLLTLSDHTNEDESSAPRGYYLPPHYEDNIKLDVSAWDKMIPFLKEYGYNTVLIDVGDGIKYESHPEISAPNAWDKDFAKKKLDEIRAAGLEPIPLLNFSAAKDTWFRGYRRMVSTPEYRDACRDLILELGELFGNPRYFHIGMDNEAEAYQKNHEMTFVRGADLWWKDLGVLLSACDKIGARPWMYSDYIWWHEAAFVEKMPKSVLQSAQHYFFVRNYPKDNLHFRRIHAYDVLEENGFDQIPVCSTTMTRENPVGILGIAKNRIAPERLAGVLTAPFEPTTERMLYQLQNAAHQFRYARRMHYPELG